MIPRRFLASLMCGPTWRVYRQPCVGVPQDMETSGSSFGSRRRCMSADSTCTRFGRSDPLLESPQQHRTWTIIRFRASTTRARKTPRGIRFGKEKPRLWIRSTAQAMIKITVVSIRPRYAIKTNHLMYMNCICAKTKSGVSHLIFWGTIETVVENKI